MFMFYYRSTLQVNVTGQRYRSTLQVNVTASACFVVVCLLLLFLYLFVYLFINVGVCFVFTFSKFQVKKMFIFGINSQIFFMTMSFQMFDVKDLHHKVKTFHTISTKVKSVMLKPVLTCEVNLNVGRTCDTTWCPF